MEISNFLFLKHQETFSVRDLNFILVLHHINTDTDYTWYLQLFLPLYDFTQIRTTSELECVFILIKSLSTSLCSKLKETQPNMTTQTV